VAANIGFTAADVPVGASDVATELSMMVNSNGSVPLIADWDIGGFVIKNSGAPVLDADLTNKLYVDEAVQYLDNILPACVFSQLQITWVQAAAMLYFNANVIAGNQFTIHGVTYTYVGGAPALPTDIQVGGNIATSVTNTVNALLADNVSLTADGIVFNTNFTAEDFNAEYVVVRVINEDPPNTPEDGNTKTISSATVNLSVVAFRGGRTLLVFNTGILVHVLDTNDNYRYLYNTGWNVI
jgi:hypothetical protein